MKRAIRLLIVALMSATMVLGAFGCGDNGPKPWEGKTVINFGCYEGGWGREWLDKAIEKFQEMYPEYYVAVDYNKDYAGAKLFDKIDVISQDIFYTTANLYDYLENNKLMDINDVMTTPLNEYLSDSKVPVTETKTIDSKITGKWQDMKDYCLSYNGKYYTVPFGGGFYSLNYDRDLFNKKQLFLDENGDWCDLKGDLSAGQDGIKGTYDDGLPVTYDEFKDLLARMKTKNIAPFLWSSISGYVQHFAQAVAVAQDGADVFDMFKFMSGEYTFNGDSTPTTITTDNAYLLRTTNGKKDALQFCKDVIAGKYYDSLAGTAAMDFRTAQDTFLLSVETSTPNAFFIDGGHWHNEAKSTLARMADMSESYKDRQFGVMPFPWFSDKTAQKTTYFISSPNSCLCIRKNATEPEGCKKLLAFLNSDEAVRICSRTCGIVRFMNYELSASDFEQMPYYYKTMWEAARSSDICYNICDNPVIFRNYSYFDEEGWEWKCSSGSLSLSDPLNDFKNKTVSVSEFFTALSSNAASDWKKLNFGAK